MAGSTRWLNIAMSSSPPLHQFWQWRLLGCRMGRESPALFGTRTHQSSRRALERLMHCRWNRRRADACCDCASRFFSTSNALIFDLSASPLLPPSKKTQPRRGLFIILGGVTFCYRLSFFFFLMESMCLATLLPNEPSTSSAWSTACTPLRTSRSRCRSRFASVTNGCFSVRRRKKRDSARTGGESNARTSDRKLSTPSPSRLA